MGEAESSVINAIGLATANQMKLKAEAYKKYNEAAHMWQVCNILPQFAGDRTF